MLIWVFSNENVYPEGMATMQYTWWKYSTNSWYKYINNWLEHKFDCEMLMQNAATKYFIQAAGSENWEIAQLIGSTYIYYVIKTLLGYFSIKKSRKNWPAATTIVLFANSKHSGQEK